VLFTGFNVVSFQTPFSLKSHLRKNAVIQKQRLKRGERKKRKSKGGMQKSGIQELERDCWQPRANLVIVVLKLGQVNPDFCTPPLMVKEHFQALQPL
jgi:hypothetical protein